MLNVQFITDVVGVLGELTDDETVETIYLEHVIPTTERYRWIEFLSIHTTERSNHVLDRIKQLENTSLILDTAHVMEDDVISVLLYADEPDRHVLTTLTELGCVPFRVRASADRLYVGGVMQNWEVLKTIGEELESNQQRFDLLSVDESNTLHRPFDESRMKHVVRDALTVHQYTLLETAYEAGYFQVPKETTSQQLAEQLDMSQSTFSEQFRAAQAELYQLLFQSNRQ